MKNNRGQTTFSQLIEVCPYDDNQKRKGTGLAFFNALYYVISRGDSQEDILFE